MAFSAVSVQPVLTQNQDISNFHGSLTLINGKLISYFRSPWYLILSIGLIFLRCICMGEKCPFTLSVQHLLTQHDIIWNFHGLLTLHDGKLISHYTILWYQCHFAK